MRWHWATHPTSSAKSLSCDTANEHALTCTRETCMLAHVLKIGRYSSMKWVCSNFFNSVAIIIEPFVYPSIVHETVSCSHDL